MVEIEELAVKVGNVPEAIHGWMGRLGIKSHQDWAGRDVVEEKDTKRILDAIRDARLESAELHEGYARYQQEWERQRRDAGEEAFTASLRKAMERQHAMAASPPSGYAFYGGLDATALPVGGHVYTEANGAAAEARAEFQRKHPLELFDEFQRHWRKKRR